VNELATTIANIPHTVRKFPGAYGSFEKDPSSNIDVLEGSCSSSSSTLEPNGVIPANNMVVPSEVDPLVSDVYQSQPLLPCNNKEAWDSESPLYESHNNTCNSGVVDSIKIDIPAPNREEPRFPKEKCKTLLAFLFVVGNMVLTTISLALVHERVPNRDKYGPLPDIVLDHMGQDSFDWGLYTSEILIMASSFAAFLVVLFHKHRFIVMRRVFLILGLLYLMRSITMYVTVLPMANRTYYCSPKANTTSVLLVMWRSMQLLSGFGLSINGHHIYCGDYVYSGHTVILVMSYLIIREYTPRRCLLFHWLAGLAAFIGVVLILLAKAHYTLDVIIAYYVTTRLFWIYHMMANNKDLKQNGPNNFLARVWWFSMFCYFEKNVKSVVPRQFEWPFSLPRRFFAKPPNRDS
jgi:shingomyelin synthase